MFAELLSRLTDPSAQVRDRAYDEIGDLLETHPWDQSALAAVKALAQQVSTEQDPVALESLLNALVRAASRGEAGPTTYYDPLVSSIANIPGHLLPYAFEVLAQTHDRRFEPILAQYASDPSPGVREAAREALVELKGRGSG
jgi:HEAT repeat protein